MTPGATDIRSLLRRNMVFGRLGDKELAAVEREMAPMSVAGGRLLFARGEPSDALYVLRRGSLGAYSTPEAGGPRQLVALVASGETVGAFGLITRQPRTLDVRALRDSEMLRLPRAGFDALVKNYPQAMLGAAQWALEALLEESTHPPQLLPRTFAMLPFDRHVPVREVAEQLRVALEPFGSCLLLDAASAGDKDTAWLTEREHEARFVLYVDEGEHPGWREQCRRQADALLLVVNAGRQASPWPDQLALDRHAAFERPRYLLLLHPEHEILPGAVSRWRGSFTRIPRHHHVRAGRMREDLAHLARLLTRHSTALVLSGGGARGFAAIGMVRALREAGVVIDAVGGTSIGAIIGAGVACEWDDAQMYAAYHRAFVEGRPLSDRTFPLVALNKGRRAAELLHEAYGERDIEDLPLPFFCMVSNLSNGRAEVRREGRLWYWLRASSAIPGILPPVLHHGQVYVDGAVINNLPTDVMRDDGLARILACDISADDSLRTRIEEFALPSFWKVLRQTMAKQRPGALALLTRSGMVNSEAASVRRRELATHLLEPPLDKVGLLDWNAYRETVEAGYRHARRMLEEDPHWMELRSPRTSADPHGKLSA